MFISYIEGDNLRNAFIKGRDELLRVCQNIIRRASDSEIYFIDCAGAFIEGFYSLEFVNNLVDGKMDARGGIYILGKTLCALEFGTSQPLATY